MDKERGKNAPASARRWNWKRIGCRMIWYIVIAYALWCGLLYFMQDRMIFPRDMAPPPLPAPPDPRTELLRVTTEGGDEVCAWFLPAPDASPETPASVVVFFHGNAEIIDYQDDIVEGYHRLGWSVLLPEYRGYGRSGGRPSQKGIMADSIRFYDVCMARPDVDASRVVFHGRSLGGAVATAVARERIPVALILECAFASVASMSRRYLVPSFLAKHPFRTDRYIADLDIPILIFHGSRDGIVPLSHAHRLCDVARHAVYVEYDCGHNSFPGEGNEAAYWREIRQFLSGLSDAQSPKSGTVAPNGNVND